MREEFRRSELLLGPQALERLAGAHAAVFGVGGVGGHAAEALARAGVGSLTLFDSDTVALSNINRQIAATHATLGQYKVDVMAARIRDINPQARVTCMPVFYTVEDAPKYSLCGNRLMRFVVTDCRTTSWTPSTPSATWTPSTPSARRSRLIARHTGRRAHRQRHGVRQDKICCDGPL